MDIDTFLSLFTKDIGSQKAKQLKKMLKGGQAYNRIYSVNQKDKHPDFIPTYYTKPLMYAKEPYYCPNGWCRYSLDVGLTRKQFQEKYQDWPVCYHGTSPASAYSIICKGFRAQNNAACWIEKDQKAVFLTPSIVYAGHPRYAKIEKYKGQYVQIVLQLRLKKGLFKKMPGTVENTFVSCDEKVDKNYLNKQLQWVFTWKKDRNIQADDGILIYGIMLKIHKSNPRFQAENGWWEESRERLGWDKYEMTG